MKIDKHGKRIPNNFCSCGRVIYGNGAWAAHRKRHKHLNDGHHAVTLDRFVLATTTKETNG